MPWRVYRPGLVVGESKTGEMDKIDGPYYFFKLIQKMRKYLPSWMPAIGIEGGRINNVPALSPEQAADLICEAIVYEPVRVATRLGVFGEVPHALLPRIAQIVMNTSFRMFPDSDAAKVKGADGKPGLPDQAARAPEATADQVAFQQLLKGIHF